MGDLKVSVRQLLKSPGFTAAAILVLGLGIGLNATMFSLVHALAWAARPFAEPERLMQLYSRDARTNDYRAFSYPVYEALAARQEVFDGVLAHNPTIVGIGEGAESRRTFSVVVSRNYFDVLGARLVKGRGFTVEEDKPGQDIPVVIATWNHWQRTGFDPDLLGKTIRVNERPFTIIGITPRGFTGTMSVFGPELFFPLGVFNSISNDFQGSDARSLARADAYNLFLVARLRQDVAAAAATEALAAYAKGIAQAFPAEYEHQAMTLAPLPKFGTGTSPMDESAITTLGVVLLGLTAVVLLTVCLNLASMLLARGRARRKEFAVRLALGGGRARIVRQLLLEGLILSLAGAGAGLALGVYALDALMTAMARLLPITVALEQGLTPALVGAAAFFGLTATAAFALGPALKHSGADILTDLKAQPGDDPAPRRWRFVPRNPLVAGQVALSLCLLIAAGLFLRMALGAASVDFGFRADDTVLAEVDSRLGGFDEPQSLDAYARIERRLASLPGVKAASIGAIVPMGMVNMGKQVRRAGVQPPPGTKPATAEEGRAFSARWNSVGGTYFEAMGLSVLQGRTFTDGEVYATGAPMVAVLDEALARKLWPAGDALGQRIQWETDDDATRVPVSIEVVGIVPSTRRDLFEREPVGAVYVPFAQGFQSNAFFHVRPERPSDALVDVVRAELRQAVPGMPLFGARTFGSHVQNSAEYWMLKLSSSMFSFFGGMAMVVALVGLYGVTAYTVARRTKEIGVRIAVGARPGEVVRLILSESLITVTTGVFVGWLLGVGIGQVLANTFVDLPAFDGWVFGLVPIGFVAASLGAAWVPARRATAINPVTALRAE
jgi:predicted permease